MARQHIMTCPKCGSVVTSSAGVGKGLTVGHGMRANHDKALQELSTPGPRRVTDGPRAYPAHLVSRDGGFQGRI